MEAALRNLVLCLDTVSTFVKDFISCLYHLNQGRCTADACCAPVISSQLQAVVRNLTTKPICM